jgi:hypothetical protein
VELSRLSCHRAKKMALSILDGRDGEQYRHIREYASTIIKWNPGSSAFIQRDGRFFQQMYVSLAACKQVFLAAYRPMICVDACFLKGNGVVNCMQPLPRMITMIFTLSHMRYAR